MNTTFRSDRRFEFEKFKRFELSGWKRAVLPFYLIAVIVTIMFERNWKYPYSIYRMSLRKPRSSQ